MNRKRALWLNAMFVTLVSTANVLAGPPVDQVAFAPPANARLPLDVHLLDEHGRAFPLGDYLRRGPALVVPVYYGCGNLCGVVLQGLAGALRAAALEPGRDVEVVAISIAPLEGPAAALEKKRAVLGDVAAPGWHFLTGDDTAIARVASAFGYRYTYDAGERQYAHASGIAFLSSTGHVARVMYGASFAANDLRDALAAARVDTRTTDTPRDEFPPTWLLCFHYDPQTGRYSFAAMNAVRAAGMLTLVTLAVAVVRMRRRGPPPSQQARP